MATAAHVAPTDRASSPVGNRRDIVFVSCTRGAKEKTGLFRSLEKLGCGANGFQFLEDNRRGLPECYNTFLEQYAGSDRILVFAHDDVCVGDVFFREKLFDAVTRFNIVGLAGAASFDLAAHPLTVAWTHADQNDLSGAVEHRYGNGISAWTYYGYTPKACVVLDGLFLAVDMRMVTDLRFDPCFQFHCYDLDFCLSARQKGLTLGTTNIYVQHGSLGGCRSAAYLGEFQKLRQKWQDLRKVCVDPVQQRVIS